MGWPSHPGIDELVCMIVGGVKYYYHYDGLGSVVAMLEDYPCQLYETAEMVLKNAMTEFGPSARAHDKICKVARTIADLDEKENIAAEHIAEAVSYRKLDRSL